MKLAGIVSVALFGLAAFATPAVALAAKDTTAGCAPALRTMPSGDATSDAAGLGQMFESINVPGVTDVVAATNSGVMADFDGDKRVDILLVQSGGDGSGPGGRLRLLLNKGCFRFEEHTLDIQGDGLSAGSMGLRTQIANVADFNKDGFLDILLTRNRGGTDARTTGNSLLISNGAFDRFRDEGKKLGISNDQAYNRATAIGDLNGDGWLDFAVGSDNIGNTGRLGLPRHRLYVFQPGPNGFEDGHFQDMSGTDLAPGFPGEFTCNPNIDRAGPDIMFRDLDGDGDLDIVQSYHVDMNGARATDLCASGEYWTGVWVWKNQRAETGKFTFERVQGNGLAEEGRARYDVAKGKYYTQKPAMSLPYIFSADVNNDGLQDVLAIGPTDPSWTVKTDPSAVRFWLNKGGFKFEEVSKTNGLQALDWTYKQWADFWGVAVPPETKMDKLSCEMNQLQVSVCSKMTIGDYKFYFADALMDDFNNDGNVDIVVADRREADGVWGVLRNVLFLGDGLGGFKPVKTEISGIDRNCISMEAADLNGDGLLDFACFASPYNSYPRALRDLLPPLPEDRLFSTVYWNTGANGGRANHWMELRFPGIDPAKLIGAQVELREGDAILGSRQLQTARAYKSGGELSAHFGLGKRRRADVLVRLATGETRVFKGLQSDAIYELNLSSGKAAPVVLAPGR